MIFRPLALDDIPLLAEWRTRPHVRQWWNEPGDLDAVVAKYAPRISGEVPTQVFIVELDGVPIGWMQRYRVDDHPSWAASLAVTDLALGRTGEIDYAIADPDRIGGGIGTSMIAEFSRRLLDDWPDVDKVVAAPQQANRASCRALEKAGFELAWTGMLDSDDPSDAGTAALYVLTRR